MHIPYSLHNKVHPQERKHLTGNEHTLDTMVEHCAKHLQAQLGPPRSQGKTLHNGVFNALRMLHMHRVPRNIAFAAVDAWTGGANDRAPRDWEREKEDAWDSISRPREPGRSRRRQPQWPPPDRGQIEEIYDVHRATIAELRGQSPVDMGQSLPTLAKAQLAVESMFDMTPETLLTAGKTLRGMLTLPYRAWSPQLQTLEFLVPNLPATQTGRNMRGDESRRCREMFPTRHYLVCDIDPQLDGEDSPLWELDVQASIAIQLARDIPLSMVVFTAGKGLHLWFPAVGRSEEQLRDFFGKATSLGADPELWKPEQPARSPYGFRPKEVKPDGRKTGGVQEVLYLDPDVCVDPTRNNQTKSDNE